MKIAVVLSGYFRNGYVANNKIQNFFRGLDVSFYIHCWEPSAEPILKELYNPKKIICEPQIDFKPIMNEYGLSQEWFDEGFIRAGSGYDKALIERSLSFYYSRKMSIELIDEEYDLVFIMRLDIGMVGPDEVNFPYRYKFNIPTDKIVSVYWEQLNAGLGDMWFISNLENAKKIATLYDKALNYFKPNSLYSSYMENGWPDSEEFDFWARPNDSRQYSNIVCNGSFNKPLMKYPRWYCVNNHSIYKFFFIDIGLYNQLVYI